MRIISTSAVVVAAVISMSGAPAFAQAVPPLQPPAASSASIKDIGTGDRASKVIGSTVVNEQNETVGKVDDLILSPAGGDEPVAVLAVGGFLGVGSKLVAVRYEELKPGPSKGEFVLPGATKDSLKALPEFDYPR